MGFLILYLFIKIISRIKYFKINIFLNYYLINLKKLILYIFIFKNSIIKKCNKYNYCFNSFTFNSAKSTKSMIYV